MPFPLLALPVMPAWAHQLAGILPLTALIEFIDVAMKLHTFELYGSVPLWNWPITPAGARLLLSTENTSDACCLDRSNRCEMSLHCIDGRHGDWYPSSAPTTTRLCVSTCKVDVIVRNKSQNISDERGRKQRLEFFSIALSQPVARSATVSQPYVAAKRALWLACSLRYLLLSTLGWLCWVGAAALSLTAGLYVAATYLTLMPVTGYIVSFTHGGKPRRLLDVRPCNFTRVVIATSSLNAPEWWAFYGGSSYLNSLLNKPLYRAHDRTVSPLLRVATRGVVISQWAVAVVSCAQQDGNALVIAFWLFICAITSAYIYPPEKCVVDWLRHNNLVIRRIQTTFSSRRAMLSALVYLNPDTRERRLGWINPILADGQDRREWESALMGLIETGSCVDPRSKTQYWWKFIEEGLDIGRRIEILLHQNMGNNDGGTNITTSGSTPC
ncbi:hypothetical protein EPUS_07420 [Endocarpon pusillum Z07020]|uniref:Uncharacterized protein n=1 Tax=Endocarpon pusillum (strain Z07020 / HMAS-L-300199) TaxID=1263415 RepID=U1G291_ENDPU|nr:uncharacterized protein EPUS_07420 [Endocarpon pusillum Z07020]ERF71392.1 hypothetical protein EPUS_07420 [Endocarpon pusillum Z07020]